MIIFSNAKINIGLNIISKRKDGFHNIQTVFYPIALSDIIEVEKSDKFEIINTGIIINQPVADNLCTKAYNIIKRKYAISPVRIHLHKSVPFGAGLGGGSSNASHVLIALNKLYNLGIENKELAAIASKIGSDCSFFIYNKAAYATGKGDIIETIDLDLSNYSIVVVFPQIHINTAEAYKSVNPGNNTFSLKQAVFDNIVTWKFNIKNDFEKTVFDKHPEIKKIKEKLYANDAIYASMSGSGSAVYGIFEKNIDFKESFYGYKYWCGKLL